MRSYFRGQNLLKVCRVLAQKSGSALLDAEESLEKIGSLPVGKHVALRFEALPKFKSFVADLGPLSLVLIVNRLEFCLLIGSEGQRTVRNLSPALF